jgi:RHS repeat-associated protein
MSYLYDPDGKRVARVQNGAMVKQDYYDLAGREIAETDGSGTLLRAEIYAGGRHLATWSGSATYFNHADWLGTERVRSNSSGTVCETITSLPFGDGQQTPISSCGDPSPNHFTGLETDAESGLDHTLNRQFASSYGRWLTPDPGGRKAVTLTDPQTWNMYAYAGNNPTTFSDPSGLNRSSPSLVWSLALQGLAEAMWQAYQEKVAEDIQAGEATQTDQSGATQSKPVAQQQVTESSTVNKLTVGEIAGIVYNETQSISNSGQQNDSIDTARGDVAHAIINADNAYGDKRDQLAGTAPSGVSEAAKSSDQYKSSLAAAKQAYSELQAGRDPTGGATHFNLRGTDSRANFMESKTNPGFAIKTHSGPFNNSYPQGGLPATGV